MSFQKLTKAFEDQLQSTEIKLTICTKLPSPNTWGGFFSSSENTNFLVSDIVKVIVIPVRYEDRPMMDLETNDYYQSEFHHQLLKGLSDDYKLRPNDPRTIIKMTNGNEFLVAEDRNIIRDRIDQAISRIILASTMETARKELVKFEL